jgi:hypothetical protein
VDTSASSPPRTTTTPFATAIFTGAFLLFLIQPLAGRYVLPWFGGAAGTWTVCLLFFQSTLFGGYAYAHLLNRWLPARRQIALHLGLLLGAVVWLPPIPQPPDVGAAAEHANLVLLWTLVSSIGPLFVLLAATNPLIQCWFHAARSDRSPYRLYGLSNLGSFSALIAYPVLLEPFLTRSTQAWLWAAGYIGFVAACAWCARSLSRKTPAFPASSSPLESSATVCWGNRMGWLLWSALGTALLAATTATMSADIPSVPFLWILPLLVYLLSFVVTFNSRTWYRPNGLLAPLMISAAVVLGMGSAGTHARIDSFLAIYLAGLALALIAGHGAVYRSRPHPSRLTEFYLTVAAGGALGTLWVAVVSPRLIDLPIDLPILWSLLICLLTWRILQRRHLSTAAIMWWGHGIALVAVPLVMRAADQGLALEDLAGYWQWQWPWLLATGVGVAVLTWLSFRPVAKASGRIASSTVVALALLAVGYYMSYALERPAGMIAGLRGFYGTINIIDRTYPDSRANQRLMANGSTTHGVQLTHPDYRRYPTSYYSPDSGVGRTLRRSNQSPGRQIGVVGLGVGTLAAYGTPGDKLRFYEINPQVITAAREHFDFLPTSRAQTQVVLGDGRLRLEEEIQDGNAPPYDILVLDAFSGDAVPLHLLTLEAFNIYLDRLAPEGVLAINISNRVVNLRRAIMGSARQHRLHVAHIDHFPKEDDEHWQFSSSWLLLARSETALNDAAITEVASVIPAVTLEGLEMTDEFTSLIPLLY